MAYRRPSCAMARRSADCLFLVLGLLAMADMLPAQTGAGQIQGTVRDATGAVVPSAAVVLEHVQTGNKYQSTSSEAGIYVFPALQTGSYNLRISVPGMEMWEGQILLQVGQQAVVDAALKVA